MTQSSAGWQAVQDGSFSGTASRPRPGAESLINVGLTVNDTTGEDKFTALAGMVWETLLTGVIPVSGSEPLPITARQWLDTVKWMTRHVDGSLRPLAPAAAAHDDPASGGSDAAVDPAPADSVTPHPAVESASPDEGGDALPQLDSYLAQFTDAAPPRPYIKPEPIVQVGNPELARKLLLQVRAERLAKLASAETNLQ